MALPSSDVLDLLLDAICVVDRQGRFLSITGACESIFGYKPEEMVGRPMIEFVYYEDVERTLSAVKRVEAGYLQRHFENRYVRKDGTLVTIMWSARLSESGDTRVAVARDVTHRHQCLPEEFVDPPAAAVPGVWYLSGTPPLLMPPAADPIALSALDYALLCALATGEQCVSREDILAALSERFPGYDRRRLDTQMRRLRRKVEEASGLRLPVSTVRNIGFWVSEPIELRRQGQV
ncbi:hypothetical protein CDO44_07835 [Pigmentiphaga sp. NML080357]|uniref:PAS domain S-box protein n=1 Tax=Pigmentiphaga sp. NML080357 TaxID=2008675 RepID=UPI000B41B4DB|nr:PAS domain S-box protein [Pigmentiphaga sp. NML080357]OVZ60629.1 hypothetical protein CDO44_07835 [Pigmentiphaga sp. NML080357]